MKIIKFFIIVIIFSLLQGNVYSNIKVDVEHIILQDHHSGKILYEKEADEKIYPASMTKIMTAIVTFDLLGLYLHQNIIDWT